MTATPCRCYGTLLFERGWLAANIESESEAPIVPTTPLAPDPLLAHQPRVRSVAELSTGLSRALEDCDLESKEEQRQAGPAQFTMRSQACPWQVRSAL